MATNTTVDTLQDFQPGSTIIIGGKKFTVDSLGDSENHRPHILSGARGAGYYLMAYLPSKGVEDRSRHYIVSMRGSGEPLRDKAGRRLEAIIFGDLLSSAH